MVRTITVTDEQLGTTLGELYIFEGGRRGATYQFRSLNPSLSDSATSGELPTFLKDALPDSWGRRLIKRQLQREPLAHDLLLMISDDQRLGALRFWEDGTALAPGIEIPPLIELGAIDNEVKQVLRDPTHRVSELIGIGSHSLGGARPKATVKDKAGNLWVAKFATSQDSPQTEVTIMQVAQKCGLNAAETKGASARNPDVVLSKRFDREGTNNRIGMRSFATVLNISDSGEGADWLDLASHSSQQDQQELWRRCLFGLLINNTDDHIRNHSQIRPKEEWILSPAYDITQNPHWEASHALSLFGNIDSISIAEAMGEFGELCSVPTATQRRNLEEYLRQFKAHKLRYR